MYDQDSPRKPLSLAWPVAGMALCAFLFVLAMLHAVLSLVTGSWGGGSSSPLLDFTLVAPVAGFATCLVWLIVSLVLRRQRG